MGIQFKQAIANDGQIQYLHAPDRFVFSAQIMFTGEGFAGIQLGVKNTFDGGYALMLNPKDRSIHFMQIKPGGAVLLDRGLRYCDYELNTWYPILAQYDGQVLTVWFNESPLDTSPWPKYEFELRISSGVALDTGHGNAQFKDVSICELKQGSQTRETYSNPIIVGADPDILLHDGVYYLYNRVPNDPDSREDAYLYKGGEAAALDQAGDRNAIFRVATSTDLVHWTPFKPVFFRDESIKEAFCMSPNVFEKDGWFYLLFAAGRMNGEENFHVYYAVARTPQGPFIMRDKKPLHSNTEEIGGMPFVDEDGQCYITYVRFHKGNHIWLQRLIVRDGWLTPDDTTLTHILSPRENYEVDEYGCIVEGGVIIPHKDMYYMIYADGHYMGHYGESYAVAQNIYGPYIRYAFNPILHHHFMADGTGDGVVVYNKDKSRMYMAYHRHVSTEEVEPRMTCIDEMKFIQDPHGGPDILVVHGPTTTPQSVPFT